MGGLSEATYRVAGGYDIHLKEAGSGPVVVFLHGSGPGASGASNFRDNWQAFVDAGVRVMVADIAEGTGFADGVAFQHCDLRDDAQIAALVQSTKDRFGRIDFLVNVACSYLDHGVASTRAEWLESLDVNIVGSVMLMQAAEAELAATHGAIVNFGSISSRVAQTGRWLYPVSKAAILQLTRNQAMDLAPKGIRVNLISAGPLRTTAAKGIPGFATMEELWTGRAPLGWDLTDTEAAAKGLVALLSDWFPATTGEMIHVDGGLHSTGA